jgi:ATP-dependent 26S proteasome regulatory subunit
MMTGALMYGPPGTGKTLMARACAAQTEATFLKLAGPQLVQMFIGDGAKLVRDCFALAKEKAPAIIFIDELDAVGTKRFDSEKSGDREVQRTMLELLNQLDGFASDDRIKVLAATNRVDVLDPALLRSGRLDRKIEFPLPNEEARAQILKIHSRKMKVNPGVNWGELARSTDEFGGAMLKAVCVEAGMIALRSGKNQIGHEHYVDAIAEVQAKKKDVSINKTFKIIIGVCFTNMSYSRLSTFTHNLFFSHLRRRVMGWQALVYPRMQRRWMASDTACGIGIEEEKSRPGRTHVINHIIFLAEASQLSR